MNMKPAHLLFQTTLARVPLVHQEEVSKAQNQVGQYLCHMINEMAEDYLSTKDSTSLRSRSILARAILEAVFRLRGMFSSPSFAIRMIYASACEHSKKCQQLFNIDPNPSVSAKRVIQEAEKEAIGIKNKFGESDCENGKLNLFDIAKEGGCMSRYRSHYFQLSNYTHSSYRVAGSSPSNAGDRISDQSVLLALCLGSASLAEHYDYGDKNEILEQSKNLYTS